MSKTPYIIDIPADGNCIYILGYKIDGFESFEQFLEYLNNYQKLEKRCNRLKDYITSKDTIDELSEGCLRNKLTPNDVRWLLGYDEMQKKED